MRLLTTKPKFSEESCGSWAGGGTPGQREARVGGGGEYVDTGTWPSPVLCLVQKQQ